MQNNGQLIVVVGPSGSGKDTLLKKVIKKIPNSILVKRYITRKKDIKNEDHYSISIKNFEDKILKVNSDLKIFYSKYKAENLNEFKDKKLFALAGIGNPENFFQLIENNNLMLEKKIIFPDHYKFSKREIQNIIFEADKNGCEIIMTEKDYFKIKNFNLKNINYLKVSLVIEEQENLLSMIKEII